MSHLVCTKHKRRVMFIENKVIHRSDNSKCETKEMMAGDMVVKLTNTLLKEN